MSGARDPREGVRGAPRPLDVTDPAGEVPPTREKQARSSPAQTGHPMKEAAVTESDETPADLREGGREMWSSVADLYDLEVHEARLLHEAARTVDTLDDLAVIVAREGTIIDSPTGPRTHPAIVEQRQQRLVFGRLISAMRLPAGDEDDGKQAGARRPQRRVAFRGPQGIRGVVR